MFYCFSQNNSGGITEVDEELAPYVIVEADTHDEANRRAELLGIYFDGVDKEFDCPCCGDRWYRADKYGASETPMIYNIPVADFNGSWLTDGDEYYAHVYYADGRKESYSY